MPSTRITTATRWLPWNAPRMPRGWLGSSRTGGVIMYHMTLQYYTTMTTTYYTRNYEPKQWRDKATKVRTWENNIEEISAWNGQVLLCFSGPKLWHLLNSTRDILVHLFWAHEVIMSQQAGPNATGNNDMTLHDFEPKKPLSQKSWIKQHDRTTPTTIGFSGWQVFCTLN